MDDWYKDFIKRLDEHERITENMLFEDTEALLIAEANFEKMIQELKDRNDELLKKL